MAAEFREPDSPVHDPEDHDKNTRYMEREDAKSKLQRTRRLEALSLKLAGLTYEQIGERLETSASNARALVERNLERANNRQVEIFREIENARLDRAQAAIWSGVLDGDPRHVDTFLRISARRAKMNGLDAPTNINLSVSIRAEMEQALAELEDVILGEVVEDGGLGDDPAGYEGADD